MLRSTPRFLLGLLWVVLLANGPALPGQIAWAHDSVSVVAPVEQDVLSARNQLLNKGALEARYRWRKTVRSDAPPGWTFAVCDTLACHLPTVDGGEVSIPAGGASRLDVRAFPQRIAGTAEVAIQVDDPATGQTSVAHYFFSNQTSSTTTPLLLQVSIYPNPVTDFLFLETFGRSFRVQLHDARGRLVWALPTTATARFDLRALPRGLYTLRLFTPEGFQLGRRILKQ